MPPRGSNPKEPGEAQPKEEDYPAWPHELQFNMEVGHGEDLSPPWADGHWEEQPSEGTSTEGSMATTSGSSEGLSSLPTDSADGIDSVEEDEEWESDWWAITREAITAYQDFETNGILNLRRLNPETFDWWADRMRGTINFTVVNRRG